jgi:hypothetical protein
MLEAQRSKSCNLSRDWAILEWRDPLGLRGCGFFHLINDKIVFQRGYWDKRPFLRFHNLPLGSYIGDG